MKLTRTHTIVLSVILASLLPAYLVANWRYNAKLSSLTDMFEKEQALHLSTDKLLINCEKNASSEAYDAAHQICAQGSNIHEQTEHAIALLTQEKALNETKWYRNFGLTVLFVNLLAFFCYRLNTYLKREVD